MIMCTRVYRYCLETPWPHKPPLFLNRRGSKNTKQKSCSYSLSKELVLKLPTDEKQSFFTIFLPCSRSLVVLSAFLISSSSFSFLPRPLTRLQMEKKLDLAEGEEDEGEEDGSRGGGTC